MNYTKNWAKRKKNHKVVMANRTWFSSFLNAGIICYHWEKFKLGHIYLSRKWRWKRRELRLRNNGWKMRYSSLLKFLKILQPSRWSIRIGNKSKLLKVSLLRILLIHKSTNTKGCGQENCYSVWDSRNWEIYFWIEAASRSYSLSKDDSVRQLGMGVSWCSKIKMLSIVACITWHPL